MHSRQLGISSPLVLSCGPCDDRGGLGGGSRNSTRLAVAMLIPSTGDRARLRGGQLCVRVSQEHFPRCPPSSQMVVSTVQAWQASRTWSS